MPKAYMIDSGGYTCTPYAIYHSLEKAEQVLAEVRAAQEAAGWGGFANDMQIMELPLDPEFVGLDAEVPQFACDGVVMCCRVPGSADHVQTD